MRTRRRRTGWLLTAALLAVASGCALTRQQQLLGRWYNEDMSIRFREDGGVVFNSRVGRAVGRYVYDGTHKLLSDDAGRENLVMDVVRNGERLRLHYEVELMSSDRLKLTTVDGQPAERRPNMSRRDLFVVLKRATSDKDGTVPDTRENRFRATPTRPSDNVETAAN